MESSVSLQIQKSNKQYPIRILKYNNICIDENHVIYPTVDDTTVTPIETHTLSSDEKDGLEDLYESYKAFQAAKSAYEAVSETFWKVFWFQIRLVMIAHYYMKKSKPLNINFSNK
jgi:hypothetical protein